MTPERIQLLRALCEATTPLPWHGVIAYDGGCQVEGPSYCIADFAESDRPRADAEFLFGARTALPELLDEVERLQNDSGPILMRDLHAALKERDELREKVKTLREELADTWQPIQKAIAKKIERKTAACQTRLDRALKALRAVLIFHSERPWHESRDEWESLAGDKECTARVVCDMARAALEEDL